MKDVRGRGFYLSLYINNVINYFDAVSSSSVSYNLTKIVVSISHYNSLLIEDFILLGFCTLNVFCININELLQYWISTSFHWVLASRVIIVKSSLVDRTNEVINRWRITDMWSLYSLVWSVLRASKLIRVKPCLSSWLIFSLGSCSHLYPHHDPKRCWPCLRRSIKKAFIVLTSSDQILAIAIRS